MATPIANLYERQTRCVLGYIQDFLFYVKIIQRSLLPFLHGVFPDEETVSIGRHLQSLQMLIQLRISGMSSKNTRGEKSSFTTKTNL